MTDAQKKALIKKLGAQSNTRFDPGYSVPNREWFVGKIIEALLSQGVADANIEQQTNDIISDAGVVLKARRKAGFSSGTLLAKWSVYDQMTSRIQIIYGMIAMHPEFWNGMNADYFDFIMKRRFRALQRMNFYVNPNEIRNVFAYPEKIDMKVNKNSELPQPLWDGAQDSSMPFILTALGKQDPSKTIEELFKKNKGNDRNLFACDPVMTILLMDALREAKDANKLLNTLIAQGDHYLKIDSPVGHFSLARDPLDPLQLPIGQRLVGVTSGSANAGNSVEIELGKIGPILSFMRNLQPNMLTQNQFIPFSGPFFMIVQGTLQDRFTIESVNPVARKIRGSKLNNSYKVGAKIYSARTNFPFYPSLPFHFVTDSRSDKALFEQRNLSAADLQVGDHVFAINHPLYRMYFPSGLWGGEHSLISEIETRDSAASAFRSQLKVGGHGVDFDSLLAMGNFMVSMVNTVLSILQAITKLHLDNLKTNGRKSTTHVNFIQRVESGVNINVFEYNLPYTHKLFVAGKSETITAGFVIKEPTNNPNVFQLFNANGKDSTKIPTTPDPKAFLGVNFIGTSTSDQFIVSKWAVPFFNAQTATFENQPLFENDNKTPKLLTFDDLAKSKPFLVTDENGDAFVTRPRVDLDLIYQTFLKNSGAI